MARDLPPLVAGDGELRLARRVASYVYGRREVIWPEDAQNPEEELPDEREFGWVAKLGGPEPGLSERRFVRGDVKIDAVDNVSNVEQVLDDAGVRAGGDVFFETLIEGRGLGRLVPGRDFDEGDLVDVRFWGRILPGQLVTSVEWEGDKPSVKLGGQSISDVGELSRARAETVRLIRRERVERSGEVEKVRSAAAAAQSTANSAVEDTAQLRDVLGGPGAAETTLVAQLAAINAQIQSQGGQAQPGLLPMYIAMNTRLWEQQQEINEQGRQFQSQQQQINAQTRQFVEQQAQINAARAFSESLMARPLGAVAGSGDEDAYGRIRVTGGNVVFTAIGGWTGRVYVLMQIEALNNYTKLVTGSVTPASPVVDLSNNAFQSINSALVLYKVQK